MNENKNYTIKDIIKTCLQELSTISIPASMGPDALLNLSVPIARTMHNLEICLRAVEEKEREKTEADSKEEEKQEDNVIELPISEKSAEDK